MSDNLFGQIQRLFKSTKPKEKFLARQLAFLHTPLSRTVELYLYDNSGKIQNLDGFPMMRPIYDDIPQKLLLKCSRKTLKSTLLSNVIAMNMIRYNNYHMMYLAPQEHSTKYFSQNYLNTRFDSPGLKKILPGFEKNDVFEKKLELTKSSTILRYAKDDATRIRGPATDQNIYDECVTAATQIETAYRGSQNILELKRGSELLCFDELGDLRTDRIKSVKHRGKRPTWKVILSTGETVECTSNEKIFTNRGWVYLVQLLPDSEIIRCPKAGLIKAANTGSATHTENTIWDRALQFYNGGYSDITINTRSLLSQPKESRRQKIGNISSITYIGEQDVYDIETEIYHSFFANGIAVHNSQDIDFDILPIIQETMALSPYNREIFAGTPLTTDNTIHTLWLQSTQFEWACKCSACNHWNTLTLDNEPLKMIREHGISCSKCGGIINTRIGEWVTFNSNLKDIVGYHLAQPILPHFNQEMKEWLKIYKKVTNKNYSIAQVFNEVFGIAYDIGSKPITEEMLKAKCCVLGNRDVDANKPTCAFDRGRSRYRVYTSGVDWGVNMESSRTALCLGALRDDNVYEVFYPRIYKDYDYEGQILDISKRLNAVNAYCACDGGPDPVRGIKLAQLTSPMRTQLVRYEHGRLIQHYDVPVNSIDWRQNRWCLHRSDTMTFVFNLMKQGRIIFTGWDDTEECMRDILNIYTEVKEGNFGRQELFYRHKLTAPDDFFHALNFAVCQAYLLIGDPILNGPSTTSSEFSL